MAPLIAAFPAIVPGPPKAERASSAIATFCSVVGTAACFCSPLGPLSTSL